MFQDIIRVRQVSPSERRILHRMKRQRSNAVNAHHARVILLSFGHVRNRDIAQRVGYSPQWVRTVIHRFNRRGVAGIQWCPYGQLCSTPRKFFSDVVDEIVAVALAPPRVLIGMTQWSLSKLREYLVSQHILSHISLVWLRELLLRCGVRWRHTKTWKESHDPAFWPKYRRLRRLYRRRPAGGRRICVDESGPLNLQPRPG